MTFPVPKNLLQTASHTPPPKLREWVLNLPVTVQELAKRWSLELGAPYQPGGTCSWVAPVRDAAGRDLVLKVGWRHEEAAHEVDGLRAWEGRGAVLAHDALTWGCTSALLLERCMPGTTLAQCAPEPEQDVIVSRLLRRLWLTPASQHPFRPLQAMCDGWAAEFRRRLDASPRLLDPGLARAGVELLTLMPRSAEEEVLLCTDLHAGNVLAAEREPWLVIDPKPYVGDPAYDAVQHLLNCEERLTSDPVRLARRMAALLVVDADRLTQWLFARCVQESIDQPWLRDVAPAISRNMEKAPRPRVKRSRPSVGPSTQGAD